MIHANMDDLCGSYINILFQKIQKNKGKSRFSFFQNHIQAVQIDFLEQECQNGLK